MSIYKLSAVLWIGIVTAADELVVTTVMTSFRSLLPCLALKPPIDAKIKQSNPI